MKIAKVVVIILSAAVSCKIFAQAQGLSAAQRDQATFEKALDLGVQGEPVRAIGFLKSIESKNAAGIGDDLIQLSLARLYFQVPDLDKAIEHYNNVKKSSDFWLEAQEEKTQALGRQKKYDKVISTLTTVTAAVFDGAIGPEPYFVLGITYFKTCDYADIFKTTQLYKNRFKPRLRNLKSLLAQGRSIHLDAAIAKLDKGELNTTTVGADSKYLPRNFVHDVFVKTDELQRKEALKAKDGSRALAAQLAREQLIARVLVLARNEINEIKNTTQNLNILEAETIQRIHAYENMSKNRPSQGQLAKSSDNTLVFPIDKSGEVWLDELDSYRAQVKGCPDLNATQKRHL